MKWVKHLSGQSILEFALIFPLVFLLVTGFLDLGRAVFYYASLSNSVREAARYAIVHVEDLKEVYDERDTMYPLTPQDNALQDKVLEYSFGLTQAQSPLVKTDVYAYVTQEGGNYIKVSVIATYCFAPVTPGIKQIFGSEMCKGNLGIPIEAQSTMRVSPAAARPD